MPSITVVTDHLVHSQWIHPFTDLYMVGSEFAKDQLLEQGVPEEKIAVTGIPISLKFAQARDREQALLELGLDPYYPLVLIMAGAEGMSPSLPRLCQILFRSSVPLQAAVITGRNKVLKEKLEGLRQKGGWPLYVLGYVDNVEVWMSAARVLVGKAGGLTTAEALASRLPLVIFRPVPGQEEGNVAFLLQEGAAFWAEGPEEAVAQVERILTDPELAQAMEEAAVRLARPWAAVEGARLVLEMLEGRRRVFKGAAELSTII